MITFLFDVVWGFALGANFEDLGEEKALVIFLGPFQLIFHYEDC